MSKMSATNEEDFACDSFVPQKWRKDICRKCYQPARLHEKKLTKQPTTPPSPSSSKSAVLPPIPRSSTLPPGIKPPTPPKRVVSLKIPPGQTPPNSVKGGGGGGGGMGNNKIPAKPAPPPVAKVTSEAGARPAAQPKVFQRFLLKKEPLIDKNIPPKDRTKQKELEGIQPGIVKAVHDLAPTLKTNIPPEVQAVLDENAARAAASALKNTGNSGKQRTPTDQTTEPPSLVVSSIDKGGAGKAEAALKERSESPPPPVVPPRPSNYELTAEATTSAMTVAAAASSNSGADQKVSATAQTPEATVAEVPSSDGDQEPSLSLSLAPTANLPSAGVSLEQETNVEVEGEATSSVGRQSQSQSETQTTAELQPTTEAPTVLKEEVIVSTVNVKEEGLGTEEKKSDADVDQSTAVSIEVLKEEVIVSTVNVKEEGLGTEERKSDADVDQATAVSEVEVESEHAVEAPPPVTAEGSVTVAKPQEEEQHSNDQKTVEQEEEREDAVDIPLPQPDAEIRVEPPLTEPTAQGEEEEEHGEDLKVQPQPELDSEVKEEPQPTNDEDPLVCTEFFCPLPMARDYSKGEVEVVEVGKKENDGSQLAELDSELKETSQPTLEAEENVAAVKASDEALQDEGKVKEEEEEKRDDGESQPCESVVEEEKEEVTVDLESVASAEAELLMADQSQRVDDISEKQQEDVKLLPESQQQQSKVEENEQVDTSEGHGEIDQCVLVEPLAPAAVPQPSPSEAPAQKQDGENEPAASETMATQNVAAIESQSEGTGGAITDPSPLLPTSFSGQSTDHLTGQQAQEATNEDNSEAIEDNSEANVDDSEENQPIEKQQLLDETPTLGGKSSSDLSTERDNFDLTTNQATSLLALEEGSSRSAAATDLTLGEESPEEEVKSKIPPPPPAPWVEEQGDKEEGETEEGESASESTPIPPASTGDSLPPPPPPPPPPPIAPPPPPPLGAAIPKGPPKATDIKKAAQSVKPPKGAMAYEEAMAAIKGGVKLRSVPAPVQRPVGEEKVVDVASELRLKMLKQRRKEAETVVSKLEQHKEEANKIAELLKNCSGTHSFIHQLKSLLATVDTFLAKCNIEPEILAQKLQWPADLVCDLREVIDHMTALNQRVVAAESLCKQTLLNSTRPVPSPPPRAGQTSPPSTATKSDESSTRGVNPAAVERCVQGVVKIAKDLSTDESRYFRAAQSYPVDASDIQGMIQRAADTIAPLIELMYNKALQAHQSIFDVSVTKFDQGFRVQNARRLLKVCCDMSDVLGIHLQLPKHALYSEAKLKYRELEEDFHNAVKVMERRGDWDSEEQLQLGTQTKAAKKLEARSREASNLVQRIVEVLSSGVGLPEDLEGQLTAEVLARIELQLLKAVMATGQLKVVDGVCALKCQLYTGEEAAVLLHKYDFEWLLEAVVKGNHNLITHLVQSCGMFINAIGSAGMSVLHRAVQRQDLPTVTCLIRLGADPLLCNTFNSSSAQMLALKCFPPSHFSDKQEEKEPLFDLTVYINNPSLSDVVLVSDDGQKCHAHRIVLCAQSEVLKTMLESEVWVESKNKEVALPTISGRVLQMLLKYLYTGRCLFPRDDLNLGLELMAAADQFLLDPMKVQCERVLSEKIDVEVVVPLYHAAFRFNTPKLLASCCHYLLSHYSKVEDPNHETLLHILDNSTPISS